MKFKIITTQPEIFSAFLKTGLISRGIDKSIIDVKIFNLHDYAFDKHKSVDDTPYGGGAGMVLRVDVMANALSKINPTADEKKSKTVLLTPQGKPFNQQDAKRLAKENELVLISGRFEGYDERIRDLVDEEISIGDFVLTSGDLPAMVLIDAISRQIAGFINREESIAEESFSFKIENCKLPSSIYNLLEYPQYTRPEIFRNKEVPKVLLSGNHAQIAEWRQNEAVKKTRKNRSDLCN